MRQAAGSTGLIGWTERGFDESVIDNLRRLDVTAIPCGKKIRIDQQWWRHVWMIRPRREIPENIKDLNRSTWACSQAMSSDQPGDWLAGVDRKRGRLQHGRQLVRSDLASPIRVVVPQICSLQRIRVPVEAPRVEFCAQCRVVVRHPFLQEPLRIEQTAFTPAGKPNEATGLQVLYRWSDRSQGNVGRSGDFPIVGLKQVRPTEHG